MIILGFGHLRVGPKGKMDGYNKRVEDGMIYFMGAEASDNIRENPSIPMISPLHGAVHFAPSPPPSH